MDGGARSNLDISELLDKIMEDEERKSKRKLKDNEYRKKKNYGNNKEHFTIMTPQYGPPVPGNFAIHPNQNKMHMKPIHPMSPNMNNRPPLPPNGSVPPHLPANFSHPPPPIPIASPNAHSLIPNTNHHPLNTGVPPHCKYFPPPINPNPEAFVPGHPNVRHGYALPQNFSEPNATVPPFPIDPPNQTHYSGAYNTGMLDIDKNVYNHKNKVNSLSINSVTTILPPPPSPPKLRPYSGSSFSTSPHSINSPKCPYTPPECPPSQDFNSKNSSSKISHTPKYSDSVTPLQQTHKPRESSDLPPKQQEKKNYRDGKSSYDKKEKRSRDRREDSYESKKASVKNYKDRKKPHSESDYKYEKYGHSQNDKKINTREVDHRSGNKYINRQSLNEPRFPLQKEKEPFNINGPTPPFDSFNGCPPFNAVSQGPFKPVHQESSFPVVEGMPFPPPPGLNLPPVNCDSPFNSGIRPPPFRPEFMSGPPPFNPGIRPPFNSVLEQPINIGPSQPPFSCINEPPFIPMKDRAFNNKERMDISDYEYDKVSHDSKPTRNNHKNDKRKRKHCKESESDDSETNEKSLKRKREKIEKDKKKPKIKKKENYELEPGECLSSDTSSSDDSSSSDDESDSEDSSSSSSDSEDSLYKLEFLNNKKPKITRFDNSDKENSDDNISLKSIERPKFPRYFKDKVAYCDDTSSNTLVEQEVVVPFSEKSEILSSKIEKDSATPVSPLLSESLKATKTPLIKRLGLAENRKESPKDNTECSVNSESNVHQDNGGSGEFLSGGEDAGEGSLSRADISPFTFEQYMQRSSSLSPNNSLDFEEYKLLVSTKEILTASKSIFKSPTSPKSTTTKKKYEKPIIKVETASKPSPYHYTKESPQRIDLDSRIRLMFGMKSACDNSPEKKNFRNAAFSYKNMRLLSRPPSPFRNRSAYQFWHRETYYFRKNNPIPDIFADPSQKKTYGLKAKGLNAKLPRFPNLKEDYYQIREIEPRQSTKSRDTEIKKSAEDDKLDPDNSSQSDLMDNTSYYQQMKKEWDDKEENPCQLQKQFVMPDRITKINVSPNSELELVAENTEEKNIEESNSMIQMILSRIVEELKNELKNKLTEEILDDKLNGKDKVDDKTSDKLFTEGEVSVKNEKLENDKNEGEHLTRRKEELNELNEENLQEMSPLADTKQIGEL